MNVRNRLWYAFYKGWFAGRAGRRRPHMHSMVEHAYMVDGYDSGRNSAQGISNRETAAALAHDYDDQDTPEQQ